MSIFQYTAAGSVQSGTITADSPRQARQQLRTVVLPMLLENLLEAGRTLPWPTRVLKSASDALTTHGWWMASAAIGLAGLFLAAIRTQAGRRTWHRVLLKLPLIGPMAKKQELSRIALVVSTLLRTPDKPATGEGDRHILLRKPAQIEPVPDSFRIGTKYSGLILVNDFLDRQRWRGMARPYYNQA